MRNMSTRYLFAFIYERTCQTVHTLGSVGRQVPRKRKAIRRISWVRHIALGLVLTGDRRQTRTIVTSSIVLTVVRERNDARGESIARVPLRREVGSLSSEYDSVVLWRDIGSDGVTRKTRVLVGADSSALSTIVRSLNEVLGVNPTTISRYREDYGLDRTLI
jgi:hypothetical protein